MLSTKRSTSCPSASRKYCTRARHHGGHIGGYIKLCSSERSTGGRRVREATHLLDNPENSCCEICMSSRNERLRRALVRVEIGRVAFYSPARGISTLHHRALKLRPYKTTRLIDHVNTHTLLCTGRQTTKNSEGTFGERALSKTKDGRTSAMVRPVRATRARAPGGSFI